MSKKLTKRRPLRMDSSECPWCRSYDIAGDSYNTDWNEVSQEVSCQDCGAVWIDTYALHDRELLLNGDKKARKGKKP